MNLYHIDLDVADTDPLNQLRVEAEVKYALLEDYEYIIDLESRIFSISERDSEIILIELPDEDEDDEELSETEDECETDDADYDEYERLTTSEIIETIIRNSLLSDQPITLEQAKTMLILANLKSVLDEE